MEFLDWLNNSILGSQKVRTTKIMGIFAIMQKGAIALFCDNEQNARHEILLIRSRMDEDIEPDGSQPRELDRTRSWHYSNFNLVGYLRAAATGKKVGIDFWGNKGLQGQSMHGAVEFLIPAATSSEVWRFPDNGYEAVTVSDVVHAAADEGNLAAKEALSRLEEQAGRASWWRYLGPSSSCSAAGPC